MRKLIEFGIKRPYFALLILIAGVILAVPQLGKIYLDTSEDSMVSPTDPLNLALEDNLEKFGSDMVHLIYIEDDNLFSVEKLTLLDKLLFDLGDREKFPAIERIDSLYSVSNIKGYPDYVDTNALMTNPPKTEAEALRIKEAATGNPILVDNMVSADGRVTIVMIYLKTVTSRQDSELVSKTVQAVRSLIDSEDSQYLGGFTTLFDTGGPAMREDIADVILVDMVTIIPMAFGILFIMLILTTGSLNSAILPLITSLLSILYTFGFMGAMGLPVNFISFTIPILIIVIGSTEDIHILSEFKQEISLGKTRKEAIKHLAKAIGTALFLTALTTFLGFLAISINKITALIQFGFIAGFAMLINPITTCLITPLYLRLFGTKKHSDRKRKKGKFLDWFAGRLYLIVRDRSRLVLTILLMVSLGIGFFAAFIEVNNDSVDYFKPNSTVIIERNIMHDNLAGSSNFNIHIRRRSIEEILPNGNNPAADVIEAKNIETFSTDEPLFTEDSLNDDMEISLFDDGPLESVIEEPKPDILGDNNAYLFQNSRYLAMISDIQDVLVKDFRIDKSISIADYIKLLHREMNYGRADEVGILPSPSDPASRDLIAQYAINLHQGEISSYITGDWSEANIIVRHKLSSSREIMSEVTEIQNRLNAILAKTDPLLIAEITGSDILVQNASNTLIRSQILGLSLLLLMILIIMSILFMNVKAGLLALMPNLLPIFIVFGTMGILKIPLNIGTSMVAVIAIGISVDDTIHFMTRFNQEMRQRQDRDASIKAVLSSEIRPIIVTSFALILCFLSLSFAHLVPIIYLGLLSALAMFMALVADLLLTPILLSKFQVTNLAELNAVKLAEDLRNSELFKGMSLLEIKRFTLLTKKVDLKNGDHIIRTGEVGRQMFIILSGSVVVERIVEDKPVFISKLGTGDLVGEMALLQNVTRTADVRAVENLSCIEIDWNGLQRLEKSAKSLTTKLYRNIATILGGRLVSMTDNVENLKRNET